MIKHLYTLAACLICTFAATINAAELIDGAEYRVAASQATNLTRTSITARLCADCPSDLLRIKDTTSFYEINTPLTYEEALEVFLRKNYEVLSLVVKNSDKSVVSVSFGGFDELAADPNNPANQSQVEK
jgi:hypothetical protein